MISAALTRNAQAHTADKFFYRETDGSRGGDNGSTGGAQVSRVAVQGGRLRRGLALAQNQMGREKGGLSRRIFHYTLKMQQQQQQQQEKEGTGGRAGSGCGRHGWKARAAPFPTQTQKTSALHLGPFLVNPLWRRRERQGWKRRKGGRDCVQ